MLSAAISFPCKPHYSRLVCQRPAPVVGRTSTLQSVSPYSKFQLTGARSRRTEVRFGNLGRPGNGQRGGSSEQAIRRQKNLGESNEQIFEPRYRVPRSGLTFGPGCLFKET